MTAPNKVQSEKFNKLSAKDKGLVLFQQGAKFHQQDKLDEALKAYTQAVAFHPTLADAYNNMAVALRKQQKFEAALACYQRSVAIRENHGGTYSNMGNVLNDLDLIEEALEAHNKATELEPENLLYRYNLALVQRDAGLFDEALKSFDDVLAKDPNYRDLRWDRALTLLMDGRFKEGFEEYDARWKLSKSPPRSFPQDRWEGGPLNSHTLFIHREQGFGDAIQFLRLIPSIKKRYGGTIILECQPELMRLFDGFEGIDQLHSFGQPLPDFDLWVPLMSLGHILGVEEKTIPMDIPFLTAPVSDRFHVRPAVDSGLNIGIVWAGSPTHQNDRRRSTKIEKFLNLARHKNTTFFSLQKGERVSDLTQTGASCLIIDAGSTLRDFADTACVIDQLDLIITIDTSVAHLAGAMGKEVWLLLPFTPDWRWMLKREDSPWYPQMKIIRQPKPGDWDSVFKKVDQMLGKRLAPQD